MLNKLRKLQNKKGFTLVELIVVIAIIAILTAVIVPLVSRYTTQATYTSLQAGADSVQSQANAAIAAYSMTGKVFSGKIITGTADANGTPDTVSVDGTAITNTSDNSLVKMKESIVQGLSQKLGANSFFVVAVLNGGVTGVIYSPEGDISGAALSDITGYDDAYQATASGKTMACGMLGIYKTAAIDDKTLTGYDVPAAAATT